MDDISRDEKAALGASRRGSEKTVGRHSPAPSRGTQCARLLRYLRRKGRADTRDIRAALDIMSPAARIYDLRYRHGLDIIAMYDRATKIATYVLMRGRHGEQ